MLIMVYASCLKPQNRSPPPPRKRLSISFSMVTIQFKIINTLIHKIVNLWNKDVPPPVPFWTNHEQQHQEMCSFLLALCACVWKFISSSLQTRSSYLHDLLPYGENPATRYQSRHEAKSSPLILLVFWGYMGLKESMTNMFPKNIFVNGWLFQPADVAEI